MPAFLSLPRIRRLFGLRRAPQFPPTTSDDGVEVEQVPDEAVVLNSPKSLQHPLHEDLLSALDTVKRLTSENAALKEENSRLKLERPTREALEEMASLYTQANKEKDAMEDKIKTMEEDFQNHRKTWEDLHKHQLGEINHFRNKLSTVSVQMDEVFEECKRELHETGRRATMEITSLKQSLRIQREENASILSDMEDYYTDLSRVTEENAATKLRESEEEWKRRVRQLEEIIEKKNLDSSLVDKLEDNGNTMTMLTQNQSKIHQSDEILENKSKALEESPAARHSGMLSQNRSEILQSLNKLENIGKQLAETIRKERTEKTESSQRSVQKMVEKHISTSKPGCKALEKSPAAPCSGHAAVNKKLAERFRKERIEKEESSQISKPGCRAKPANKSNMEQAKIQNGKRRQGPEQKNMISWKI